MSIVFVQYQHLRLSFGYKATANSVGTSINDYWVESNLGHGMILIAQISAQMNIVNRPE